MHITIHISKEKKLKTYMPFVEDPIQLPCQIRLQTPQHHP